jgi:protease-4
MEDNQPPSSSPQSESKDWQQEVLAKLAFAAINEQRRARRWGIFFKSLFLAYLFLVAIMIYLPPRAEGTKLTVGEHTALVEIKGVIAEDSDASADQIIAGLREAFEDKNTKGIILRINSPGGSPVQAGYVNDEIHRLREKYPDTKVYAVIGDICASGGYYIASAADEIYADKGSLVGSIGVIMNGFGFVDAMHKLGVERRLYTAGAHKGFLDPFSPENKEEVKHVHAMLDQIHQQFIDAVKEGRGDRLKDDKQLFSGLIWTGEEGIDLGLVDGLGSPSYVAREVIQAKKIVDYTHRETFFDRLAGRVGTAAANTLAKTMGLTQYQLR